MPLPCPKKVNTDLGCSPKPWASLHRLGLFMWGSPGAQAKPGTIQGLTQIWQGSGWVSPAPHPLNSRISAACGLISQPEERLFLAGLMQTLTLVQNTRPQLLELHWQHRKFAVKCSRGTCKIKCMTLCGCPCYHVSQPSLLTCRHLAWFDEFVS